MFTYKIRSFFSLLSSEVETDLARIIGPLAKITTDLQAFSDKALEDIQGNSQKISELTTKNAQLKTVSDTAVTIATNTQKLLGK